MQHCPGCWVKTAMMKFFLFLFVAIASVEFKAQASGTAKDVCRSKTPENLGSKVLTRQCNAIGTGAPCATLCSNGGLECEAAYRVENVDLGLDFGVAGLKLNCSSIFCDTSFCCCSPRKGEGERGGDDRR